MEPTVAENEVIILQQEQGDDLMMRNILLQSEKGNEREPEQIKTLLRMKCKIEGKCCNLTIDSGSSKNLVSMEVVIKLNLKCAPYPEVYRVSWLQNWKSITVRERCLIRFNIGSYSDSVLFDVLPMDACRVLLGRPWQYDRRVMHDG